MDSNLTMKHYVDPTTGDKYWIRQQDEPKDGWVELEQPTEMPLPDPNYIPPYNARRISAYPAIGDQLDMLWHAMDDDPAKRLEPFYSTILQIKQDIPKPE